MEPQHWRLALMSKINRDNFNEDKFSSFVDACQVGRLENVDPEMPRDFLVRGLRAAAYENHVEVILRLLDLLTEDEILESHAQEAAEVAGHSDVVRIIEATIRSFRN